MSSINVNLSRERSIRSGYAELGRTRLQNEIVELQEQMTTGHRINRASDDADGYARARKLAALDERHQQYQRNIDTARSWTTHTQDHLATMAELVQQAHEYGLRGVNDASSDEDRETYAGRIRQLRDELIDQLNAKVGDEYLFAGNRTQDKPFVDTPPPGPTDLQMGAPSSGELADLGGNRTRRIGPNTTMAVNIDGETIQNVDEDLTLTKALDDLANALDPEDPADPDLPSLEDALANVEKARDHVIDVESEAGDIARRLDASSEQLEQASLVTETRRSQLEDADFLETATHFQQKQTQMQAALSVTASVMQTSLVDYLRL